MIGPFGALVSGQWSVVSGQLSVVSCQLFRWSVSDIGLVFNPEGVGKFQPRVASTLG
jgi:uncharacterized protein YaiE (UPF0345 family)